MCSGRGILSVSAASFVVWHFHAKPRPCSPTKAMFVCAGLAKSSHQRSSCAVREESLGRGLFFCDISVVCVTARSRLRWLLVRTRMTFQRWLTNCNFETAQHSIEHTAPCTPHPSLSADATARCACIHNNQAHRVSREDAGARHSLPRTQASGACCMNRACKLGAIS